MLQVPPIFTNSSLTNIPEKPKPASGDTAVSTVDPTNKAEKTGVVQRNKDTMDEQQKHNSYTPPNPEKTDDTDDDHSLNISI